MSGALDAAVSGRASPVGTRGRFGAPKRQALTPRSAEIIVPALTGFPVLALLALPPPPTNSRGTYLENLRQRLTGKRPAYAIRILEKTSW